MARAILVRGPSTAAELADELDLTPAAVRRHLDHLAEDGTLEARERRVYGHRGRGRPAKVFALTEAGRDAFDQAYDDLATEALRFLADTAGEEAVVRLREGLRQVRASTGTGSVCAVVEVAPWSRVPEARALVVPRDD